MEKIITQAPIQTREDTTHKHERLFPLLVAETLNRVDEHQSGTQNPRVDVWNTQGLTQEKQFEAYPVDHFVNRDQFIEGLISTRYALLDEHYGIEVNERRVIRDDDDDFVNIVNQRVEELIEEGTFQIHEEKFSYCTNCEQVIAPLVAQVSHCPCCNNSNLGWKSKKGLFIVLTPSVKSWILVNSNIKPLGASHSFISTIHNMPPMIQVSKQRTHGISLTEYGIDEDFVLDPKIALAMMETVLKEKVTGRLSKIIIGRNAVKNFVPYAILLNRNHEAEYIATGLIPPYNDSSFQQLPPSFYSSYLALIMIGRPIDLAERQLRAFGKEYLKLQRKYKACLQICKKLNDLGYEINPLQDDGEIEEITNMMKENKMREAILKLRDFIYKNISKDYIEECKEKSLRPDPEVIDQLNTLYTILCGENE